jgi:hypothetical protein
VAVDASVAELRRQRAATADHKRSLVEYGFDLIGIDARQSDQYQHLTVGLQHINRRLPAWLVSADARSQFQELLVQSFGTGKRFDRVGQHPVDGILGRHFVSPAV